jgi:hypothetical protein
MGLRKGMESFIHPKLKRANVVGFDHDTAIKKVFQLLVLLLQLKIPDGQSILFSSLRQFCFKKGDTLWSPSSFSDQVADKFYKQVVDTESYKANSLKLFFYGPSNARQHGLNGRPAMRMFAPI